ncbi:TadE-like protein [Mariprofundus aestuarium]|uniref:TadE-like protein n=1 Tax=Mariprofundus aestuarium TaxID=1921086 RepID=A0A2K8KY77_MARES|nr:TadE family protein [Mariprofundus aestuarium]ATX79918.1 TadE-like protein [Mariprofundus aestuarium]
MLKSNSTNDRRHDRSRGAVMVEFAIIMPFLILLFLGVTELGRSLYQQNILTQAVQAGARYMTRAQGVIDTDACAAGAAVCCVTDATAWGAAEAKAKELVVYGNQAAAAGNEILPNLTTSDITITIAEDPNAASIDACVITVSADVDFVGIFGSEYTIPPIPFVGSPIIGGIDLLTLGATTQERYIGE